MEKAGEIFGNDVEVRADFALALKETYKGQEGKSLYSGEIGVKNQKYVFRTGGSDWERLGYLVRWLVHASSAGKIKSFKNLFTHGVEILSFSMRSKGNGAVCKYRATQLEEMVSKVSQKEEGLGKFLVRWMNDNRKEPDSVYSASRYLGVVEIFFSQGGSPEVYLIKKKDGEYSFRRYGKKSYWQVIGDKFKPLEEREHLVRFMTFRMIDRERGASGLSLLRILNRTKDVSLGAAVCAEMDKRVRLQLGTSHSGSVVYSKRAAVTR